MRPIRIQMHIMRSMPMAVRVVGLMRTDVLHLVAGTAFRAALERPVAGDGEPDDVVGVGWAAGAAEVLFVAEGVDYDGIFERACAAVFEVSGRRVWVERGGCGVDTWSAKGSGARR